jgi:signal transduction histidine kinase
MYLEPLDGVEVLKKVAEDLREEWGFAGAKILLKDGLPSKIPLEADKRALASALTNLAISSLDDCRTDKRDRDHEVHLSVREEDGFAVFEVADNGVGMDKDTLEKIFSLFFNPKGIEAAGVGLYITHKLARLHQGSVRIESEQGQGTQYRLSIPLFRSGKSD